MGILPVKTYGEDCLRRKCEEVKKVTPEILRLINNMVETMYAAKGVGLAAPQIGVNKKIIVVDVGEVVGKHELIILLNPKIIKSEGAETAEEGCLSCPGINILVKRAKKVIVEGLNQKGEKVVREDSGLTARALQHEIDHVQGKLIVDYAGFMQRYKLKRKLLIRH